MVQVPSRTSLAMWYTPRPNDIASATSPEARLGSDALTNTLRMFCVPVKPAAVRYPMRLCRWLATRTAAPSSGHWVSAFLSMKDETDRILPKQRGAPCSQVFLSQFGLRADA